MDRLKHLSDSPFPKSLLLDSKQPDLGYSYHHSTPKIRRQIELLCTPHICQKQKDLFSQLLGTETKLVSPLSKSPAIPVQQEMMEEDENIESEERIEESEEERRREPTNEENRKRKRKSNAQLKLLKSQFYRREGGTWSKDRIVEVAALTGLSESQVYKWCWDQKKKMVHGGKDSQREEEEGSEEESSIQEDQVARTKQIKKEVATRRKISRPFQQEQRKISKKLLFN